MRMTCATGWIAASRCSIDLPGLMYRRTYRRMNPALARRDDPRQLRAQGALPV
jgi:hypothetical protein